LASAATLTPLEWASFSSDGLGLVASAQGQLALYGLKPSAALALEGFSHVAEPDWSPTAAVLALAVGTGPLGMMPMDMMPMGMPPAPDAIARVALDQDWVPGAPELLVESESPDETLHAPSFSPDGRFLAFARQRGKGDQSTLGWIDLEASGVQGALTDAKARDTVPTWLPSRVDEEYWLVFSSNRDGPYGKLPPERLQLWSVGFARGPDGSLRQLGEPFWLPCQDPGTSNVRALFAAETPSR